MLPEVIPAVKKRAALQIAFNGPFNAAKNKPEGCLGHTKCLSKHGRTGSNGNGVSEENRSVIRNKLAARQENACDLDAVNALPCIYKQPRRVAGRRKIGLKTHSVVILHGNL